MGEIINTIVTVREAKANTKTLINKAKSIAFGILGVVLIIVGIVFLFKGNFMITGVLVVLGVVFFGVSILAYKSARRIAEFESGLGDSHERMMWQTFKDRQKRRL